jgi:hypothetical protein
LLGDRFSGDSGDFEVRGRFQRDGDGGAGDGPLLRHNLLKKELQGFPGASTQIGKKIPVRRLQVAEMANGGRSGHASSPARKHIVIE